MASPYTYFGVEDPYKTETPAPTAVAPTPAPAAAAPPPAPAPAASKPPTTLAAASKPKKKKANPLAEYEGYLEAANIWKGVDSAKQAKFQSLADAIRAANPDTDFGSLDTEGFEDWEDMGPGGSRDAVNAMMQHARRPSGWIARSDDPARAANRYRINLAKQIEGMMKERAQAELMPSLDAAQAKIDEALQTSAVSAGQEQALRSRIVAQARTAEAQRSARIGATLGFGNMTSSPAAASLAADAAEDTDRLVVSTLRDLGLQVSEMNRQQQRMDADMATRISMARWAVTNGDSKSLIGMQGDIASMVDALYSRDQTLELMRKQLEDAGDDGGIGGWGGAVGGLIGGIGSFMTGGADAGLFGRVGAQAGDEATG